MSMDPKNPFLDLQKRLYEDELPDSLPSLLKLIHQESYKREKLQQQLTDLLSKQQLNEERHIQAQNRFSVLEETQKKELIEVHEFLHQNLNRL